jgi:hypothetical protein
VIIELGKTETHIAWGTGLGLLLTAITLGLLFAVRQMFIEDTVPVPQFWWRRLLSGSGRFTRGGWLIRREYKLPIIDKQVIDTNGKAD